MQLKKCPCKVQQTAVQPIAAPFSSKASGSEAQIDGMAPRRVELYQLL